MKFSIGKNGENLVTIARRIGYTPVGFNEGREFSMERALSGNRYPRFHLYVREEPNEYVFNLHLDQKKTSYGGGGHAHSGEYEGELIEREVTRIQSFIKIPTQDVSLRERKIPRPPSFRRFLWPLRILYFGFLVLVFYRIDVHSHSVSDTLIAFVLPALFLTCLFFLTSFFIKKRL